MLIRAAIQKAVEMELGVQDKKDKRKRKEKEKKKKVQIELRWG